MLKRRALALAPSLHRVNVDRLVVQAGSRMQGCAILYSLDY